MMVMINYSLEGTAYGGDYDGEIGALWIAPNRVQDEKLNCIAHELGHSFQSQITCDGQGEAWGGCGFFPNDLTMDALASESRLDDR